MKNTIFVGILFTLLWAQPMPIIINEIMYNPPGPDKEWVELYNRSDHAIILDSTWILKDNYGSYHFDTTISGGAVMIEPGGFLTVFLHPRGLNDTFTLYFSPDVDASGHNIQLNNDSDVVVLCNMAVLDTDTVFITIDSVCYFDNWGPASDNGGSSLERIDPYGPSNDPSNWGASIDSLGTPGRQNSLNAVVRETKKDIKTTIGISPNPFNSSCILELPSPGCVYVFDCTGKLVETMNPSESQFLWNPQNLASGIYFIKHAKTSAAAKFLLLR